MINIILFGIAGFIIFEIWRINRNMSRIKDNYEENLQKVKECIYKIANEMDNLVEYINDNIGYEEDLSEEDEGYKNE